MIDRTTKHGQGWDHERWWRDGARVFRVKIHTDFYEHQARGQVDMMSPAGWARILDFNPADEEENYHNTDTRLVKRPPSFPNCTALAERAAHLTVEALTPPERWREPSNAEGVGDRFS